MLYNKIILYYIGTLYFYDCSVTKFSHAVKGPNQQRFLDCLVHCQFVLELKAYIKAYN